MHPAVNKMNEEFVKDYKRNCALLSAFAAVERFNACAGGGPTIETLHNKVQRVQEEVLETLLAINANDHQETIDGVVDVLYTALGVIKAAEHLGFDVFGALSVVCKNNDTKLIDTIEHANETAVMYEEQNIPVDIRYNAEYDKFVVVNKSEQKVLKPKGYQRVELGEFVKGE